MTVLAMPVTVSRAVPEPGTKARTSSLARAQPRLALTGTQISTSESA